MTRFASETLRHQGNRLHALSHLVDGKLSPAGRKRALRALRYGSCLLCLDSPAIVNCGRCEKRTVRRMYA